MTTVNRGEVWWVETDYGEKPFLVVSNMHRNRNLDTVLAARVTTSTRTPDIDSIVPIEHQGTIVGRVLCDEIVLVTKGDLKRRASNAFTPRQMRDVCRGLDAALGCP
ncbi:MAG: type II toxin-antitoxin system PemK/MazF family toxin [Actinomycetota bacterium]|nr:type II toxin-antitoxin system PemK/MazF family toxin [Actinomycetota bacterium]